MSRHRNDAQAAEGGWRWRAALALAIAAAGGCGGAAGQVEGKVTHQGQAVARAELVFSLENQPAEVYYGISRDNGSYVVDVGERRGMPPGKYQVVVTDHVLADGKPAPGGEQGVVLRSSGQAVERKHALTKEVAAGRNEIEIKLEEGRLLPPEEP